MKIIKILECLCENHADHENLRIQFDNNKKVMKILEFHKRILKKMKVIEFHVRINKINKKNGIQ